MLDADMVTARDLALANLRAMVRQHVEQAERWRRTYKKGTWLWAADHLADAHDRMRAICEAKIREAKIRELEGTPAAKEHCPRRMMGEDQPPHVPCDTGDLGRDGPNSAPAAQSPHAEEQETE